MAARSQGTVAIRLLGDFRVTVAGREVGSDAWSSRRAAELVQLLALADERRLTRDQVIEALWPRLAVGAGAANLRKAAHYARQALAMPEAVVLRGGQVLLLPERPVVVDVDGFEAQAREALARGDATACAAAAATYGGELLPAALYEEWTQARRERLRLRHAELLRGSGQWERLIEVEPTDEPAYRELMRRDLSRGGRPSAIRWYGRLRSVLRRELGVLPSDETEAVYDECVAAMAIDEPVIVGRELEVARAGALLRSDAPTGALVVRGPAGIGKSALCRQVARIAQAERWMTIGVAATETVGPYGPLVRAIEDLVGRQPGLPDAVGDHARAVLARLTPLVSSAAASDKSLTRHEVIGAFARLLLAAGNGAAVFLAIDDAHLADEATIDVVLHLGSAVGPRLVVLLAYRREQAPDVLTRGVARLQRAGAAVEIDLEPLDREDTATLIATSWPAQRSATVLDRLVTLAEGNPFLALEIARSPVAGVPALVTTARDAIISRFVDVGEATTSMLERLALASDELDPGDVVTLADAPEGVAFAMLDRALAAGVLVVSGGRYRFRHALVRQALVDRLAPHRRLAVHRDIARRLATLGAAPGSIAHHWLEGGRPSEARPWLLDAARQAMRLGAFGDALVQVDRVLVHRRDDGDALCLRAEALDARGDVGAPAAYAAAAVAVGGQAAHDLRAKQALATIKLGDPAGGLQVLEGLQPATLEGRLAHALALCGAAALGFGEPDLGMAKAAEARRLAMQSTDSAALVIASWAHAAAAHARGDLRSSIRADLRETHALPKLAVSVFDGQLCITQRLLYGARPYSDVIAFADSLAAEAQRLGAARGRAFAVTIRGEARMLAGHLDEADDDLAAGAQLHREIGAATGEAFALQRRAEVAMYRGRNDEADRLLDEALAIARESDVGFHLFDRIYGARITAARDPASGLSALEEAETAVRGPTETCPGCRITLAVPAAIAAARAGDDERADRWAAEAEYLANVVMRLPAWDAALAELRGHRAQARGEVADAAKQLRAAAAGFAAAGQPLDEARCTRLAALES